MARGFHDGSRSLQDAFDTRALADRIDDLLVHDTIDEGDRAFIEARDMFFLATADAEGRPTCSYKGGDPGFVRVPLTGEYPESQFVVRVRARAVYPNCPRYIHRYELVRRSRFVPQEDCLTPVPQWKRSDWAFDALPAADPAREPGDRDVLGR
jgi:uncharacterized protein